MNCYVCNCFSKQAYTSIINPDWDFNKMGIGGLDNEFSAIFRRAFASRVFPPEVIEQLGKFKHIVNNDHSINIYICFLTKEIVSWWYYQHKYSGILKKNTCVKDWVKTVWFSLIVQWFQEWSMWKEFFCLVLQGLEKLWWPGINHLHWIYKAGLSPC